MDDQWIRQKRQSLEMSGDGSLSHYGGGWISVDIPGQLSKRSSPNKSIKKDYQIKFNIGFSEYLPDKLKTLNEIFKIARGCPGRKEERNNKRVD